MATMTKEQIEQKKAQLKQLTTEVDRLINELKEVGAWPLDDDDLDQVTGGTSRGPKSPGSQYTGGTGSKSQIPRSSSRPFKP
jgi:hypothetical protein